MTVKKTTADSDLCPNCSKSVAVPKSTRSFICRECDAILKVVHTDEGVRLTVVGKSVEGDPTYQALEQQVVEVKAELDDLHARYLVEADRPIGHGPLNVGRFGVLAALAGLVTTPFAALAGLSIVGLGVLLAIGGYAVNASRKRAKQAVLGEMTNTIAKVGERRDLLQRKAARIKTQV